MSSGLLGAMWANGRILVSQRQSGRDGCIGGGIHLEDRPVLVEVGLHAEEECLEVKPLDIGGSERCLIRCGHPTKNLLNVNLEGAGNITERKRISRLSCTQEGHRVPEDVPDC